MNWKTEWRNEARRTKKKKIQRENIKKNKETWKIELKTPIYF